MNSHSTVNDLLINLKPKVLRFTGVKFPSELWNKSPVNQSNNMNPK